MWTIVVHLSLLLPSSHRRGRLIYNRVASPRRPSYGFILYCHYYYYYYADVTHLLKRWTTRLRALRACINTSTRVYSMYRRNEIFDAMCRVARIFFINKRGFMDVAFSNNGGHIAAWWLIDSKCDATTQL